MSGAAVSGSGTSVLGVVGGPQPGGRTCAAVAGVLAGAEAAGADTALLELSATERGDVIAAMQAADAVVFGSPVYRATYSALLKSLLESTERGMWGESTAPLRATAAATVLTGATPHHFLATGDLRNVLAGFFAVQVLAPGLYLDHAGYLERGVLTEQSAALAGTHGAALVALASAIRTSTALSGLTPQV